MALGLRALTNDGDIVHVYDNPAAAELLGRSQAELAGRRGSELGIDAAVLHELVERMDHALATDEPCRIELTYQSPSGPRQLIKRLAAVPGAHDDAGRQLFLAVAEDVTELRALQAGVQRADRLSALGTMTAAVGHEVAGPLMALSTNLFLARQLVDRGEVSDPAQKLTEPLADAQEAADHLMEVLTTLRDFGRGTSEGATVRIGDAIRRALTLAGADIRHVTRLVGEVNAVVAAGIVPVTQILLNLLTNGARAAVQHHPDGGAAVRIAVRVDRARATLDITDNGAGIPDELRARLFQPFVTGAAARGGTGLGLYVARRLTEAAGGSLSLEPASPQGTTARLTLPLG